MSAPRRARAASGLFAVTGVSAAVQVLATAAGAPPDRAVVIVQAGTIMILATACTGLNLLLSSGRAGLERRRAALDERAAGLARREQDLARREVAAWWREDQAGGDVPRQRQGEGQ